MKTTDKIIQKYLNFSGTRSYLDFVRFHIEVSNEKHITPVGTRDYTCLEYILRKLEKGMLICSQHGNSIYVDVEDTLEDIERGYDEPKDIQGIRKTKSKRKPKKDLGRIVDHGRVNHDSNSDKYWRNKGMEMIFQPNDDKVRKGFKIPDAYKYTDIRFLEKYYGLRAFEFGNWLSQQDRENYLAGLGLALFDLHKVLGFPPEKIGIKGKLAVAFGSRGRGSALAHFEADSFTINLTRYSRPPKVKSRSSNFKRVELLAKDGGIGSFAHEFGHALDFYGGMYAEKGDGLTLSGGDSIDTKPDEKLLKKSTLRGLMEKLMYKIIWQTPKEYTAFYKKMSKGSTKYYKMRKEIFARAFEVYVHYKMEKEKYKNIFLIENKYESRYYMNAKEMKRVIKEFDALMNALKKHL